MKWRWLIGLLLLLLVIPVPGNAEDCLGYIRLNMSYDGNAASGGTVTLYDVSDSPEGVDPLEMLVYVKELGIPGTEKQVDGAGQVTFDGLPEGLYLLVQQKAAPGYYPVRPFLVRLTKTVFGDQVGSTEAFPKLEPEQKLPQTGQVVWPAWVLVGLGATVAGVGLLSRKRS